jgi:hypothetical protein
MSDELRRLLNDLSQLVWTSADADERQPLLGAIDAAIDAVSAPMESRRLERLLTSLTELRDEIRSTPMMDTWGAERREHWSFRLGLIIKEAQPR